MRSSLSLVLAAFLVWPAVAAAQTDEGAPTRELHTVIVFEQGGVPYYRVLHQTDQQQVSALAGGAIAVNGQDVDQARVLILPDGMVEATRGSGVVTTSKEAPYRVLSLRDPTDKGDLTTTHMMEVQVCARMVSGGGCSRWETARPYPEGEPGPILLVLPDRAVPDDD